MIARDWTQAGNLRSYLSALNGIRRAHSALHHYRNLQFHPVADDQVIFYSKISPDRSDLLLLAVSLDPHAAHPVDLQVPLSELGIGPSDTYQVHELLTGERHLWQGPRARFLLTPEQPAAIWSVLRFAHRENSFDYYD